ncbi:MAG: DegV family protein [Dehalococcoidia bacterium]|jgi:DegV family protein with EDD domain
MVKIVTDSTADIPADIVKKLGINIVPLNVIFGTESYRDGVDITPDQFYKRLVESKIHPTSSAQSPGYFSELFTRLSHETDEILAIVISSKLSATFESATQAKALVGDICKIEVVDSLETCGGLGLPVIRAAEAAMAGAKLADLVVQAADWCSRSHAYMVFDTLEYLRKGGRIGHAQALLGGLLKITPVLTLRDGVVTPVQRTRSRVQSMDALINLVKSANSIESLMLEDATTPEDLEALAGRMADLYPREKTYRSTVSPVIGVHVGPHVLAACFIEGK